MKLRDLIKLGKSQNIEFSKLNIEKKIERKIDIISFITHLITFLHFIFLFFAIYASYFLNNCITRRIKCQYYPTAT